MVRTSLARAIRQPKAAAVAGLVFGLILTTVLLLVMSVAPQTTSELGSCAEDQSRRDIVVVALGVRPERKGRIGRAIAEGAANQKKNRPPPAPDRAGDDR